MEPEARGRTEFTAAAVVPHRARVEKEGGAMEPVLDGLMKDPVAANRRDVELVPAAQRRRVAQREPFEERRLPGEAAGKHLRDDAGVPTAVLVARATEMARVVEVAAEALHRGAHVVACLGALTYAPLAPPRLAVRHAARESARHLRVWRVVQRLEA